MAWKQITEQIVFAHVGGKVCRIPVVAREPHTGATEVEWPLLIPALVAPNPYSHTSTTRVEKSIIGHYPGMVSPLPREGS
jgi:hypothetical protein